MITVQILTKNNEETIRKTLESIIPLEADVIIGDLGSSDLTIEICRDFGAKVIELQWNKDYSAARNLLIRDGMNMMIEPWECLIKGHEEILRSEFNSQLVILRKGVASKELRLWKGLLFKNPAYEVLEDENAECIENAVIFAAGWPDRKVEISEICSRWREYRPTSVEPWYYSAFSSLALGNKKEFIHFAEKYLAMTGKLGPAEVQMYYRMAKVVASEEKLDKAASFTAKCLAVHPTFAEFWCLMGDLFVKQGRYDKARSMYINAMTIGTRRRSDEPHPVDIDKYRKYPESMVEKIDEMARQQG
jgi:glycosyltransferase involved in cell wall biosynthesis